MTPDVRGSAVDTVWSPEAEAGTGDVNGYGLRRNA